MCVLFGEFVRGRAAVGLLALRLVVGAAFVLHGWPKFQNAFHWMGPAAPVPALFQALAALAEFGGGFALILGLLTPIAAAGIACTMAVALAMVHLPHGDPFVGHAGKPSFEPALGYLSVMVLLMLNGPGAFSLDARLFTRTPASAKAASLPDRQVSR